MPESDSSITFDRVTELEADDMTLIEGLPGHGLVAAIAVEQLTTQLGLEHYGNIQSDDFPPVTSYVDGRVQDLVRVYGRSNPAVMTLQSDVALPPYSFRSLSRCILEDLAPEFERAIFLAGAPVQQEAQIGKIISVATTASLEAKL